MATWHKVPEVAKKLGVTTKTIYRWAKGEGVPTPLEIITVNSRVRYVAEDELQRFQLAIRSASGLSVC